MIRIVIALAIALILVSCGTDSLPEAETISVCERDTWWVFSTPDSTCFSKVGYDAGNQVLMVVFRESGVEYHYYGVPEDVWEEFYDSTSLGRYFNAEIKGNYEYARQ